MINMAATVSMGMRTLRNITHLSRSVLFSSPVNRLGVYEPSARCARYSVAANSASGEKSDTTDKPEEQSKAETTKEEQKDAGPSEIEQKLVEERDKLQADVKEMKEKYMRALAETENVRTRMKKQVDDAKVFGIQGFCKDLLEVADILHQATGTVPEDELKNSTHLKSLFEGLTMTNSQMLKVFSKHGLEKIDPTVGEKFDPFFHEALFQVPVQDNSEEGTIAVTQKTGYKLHERTLRPALVGVFK